MQLTAMTFYMAAVRVQLRPDRSLRFLRNGQYR